jgi:hypothetical protein
VAGRVTTVASAPPSAPQWSGAGVRGAGRLSVHSLRNGYASMPIGSGLEVVFVFAPARAANPNVTLRVYAHVFARREHAERAKAALSANYAAVVSSGE